jgi:hypothetical protein
MAAPAPEDPGFPDIGCVAGKFDNVHSITHAAADNSTGSKNSS